MSRNGRPPARQPAPYLTQADHAELEVAIRTMLCERERHIAWHGCDGRCAAVCDAWDALIDWWQLRRVTSAAEFLRAATL